MHNQSGMAAPRRLAALTVVFLFSFAPAIAQQDKQEPVTIERQAGAATEPAAQVETLPDTAELQKSDLVAQERMADATESMNRATQAMMWAAWISVLIGAGGLTALIWTFREQRKLFRSDNQAYIEVTKISTFVHGTYGLNFGIVVANRGKTPARNLSFEGTFTYYRPEKYEYPIKAFLSLLPPSSTRGVNGVCHDMLYHFDLLMKVEDAGSHGKWTGRIASEDGDDSRHPRVAISGVLTWEDSYGGRNSIRVFDSAELMHRGQPMWSYNSYRNENE